MLRFILIFTAVLAAGCNKLPETATSTPTVAVADKSEVSAEQIKKDVVGKVLAISDVAGKGPADEWTFEASEDKQVEIIESTRTGNQLTIEVHMTTRNNPKPEEYSVQVSGRLRLKYDLKGGKWSLTEIQNVNFQYSIGVAT
ncbi:MAG: hypothetical protein JWN94_201 [Betaproteobacteria bacterium]|nr:hypothetical protein [Betaproteobacteria bacterium]